MTRHQFWPTATARFAKNFAKLGAPDQEIVRRKMDLCIQRYEKDPRLARGDYNQVRYLAQAGYQHVRELDVDGGDRAVFALIGSELRFLDVGDHDLVDRGRYTRKMCAVDLNEMATPLDRVLPPRDGQRRWFLRYREKNPSVLWHALDRRWLYHLEPQQTRALSFLQNSLSRPRRTGTGKVFLLAGPPGTGKTSILFQLGSIEGFNPDVVRLRLSAPVRDYYSSSGFPVPERTMSLSVRTGCRYVLIDDPEDWDQVRQTVADFTSRDVDVVIGLDFAQLSKITSDRKIDDFVRRYSAKIFRLNHCYRQRRKVGQLALHYARAISANTSKFHHSSDREDFVATHRWQNERMNRVQFRFGGGHADVQPSTEAAWLHSLRAMKSQPLWRHWTPLLVVGEDFRQVPATIREILRTPRHPHYVPNRQIGLEEIEKVKGVEFQHVCIALSEETDWKINENWPGQSSAEHAATRLMRIPISRATDRLDVFVT